MKKAQFVLIEATSTLNETKNVSFSVRIVPLHQGARPADAAHDARGLIVTPKWRPYATHGPHSIITISERRPQPAQLALDGQLTLASGEANFTPVD